MRLVEPEATRHATYPVKDAESQLVAIHHRRGDGDGKKFWWELPDGTVGLNGMPAADLPLYGSERVSDWDEDELIVASRRRLLAASERRSLLGVLRDPAVRGVPFLREVRGTDSL